MLILRLISFLFPLKFDLIAGGRGRKDPRKGNYLIKILYLQLQLVLILRACYACHLNTIVSVYDKLCPVKLAHSVTVYSKRVYRN